MRCFASCRLLTALVVGASLPGCVVGPEPGRPDPRLNLDSYGAAPARVAEAAVDDGRLAEWWRALGDPTLDALVADALARNLDLDAARARLRLARAQRRIAGAEGKPTVDGTGIAQRQRISENVLPFEIGSAQPTMQGGAQPGGAPGGGSSNPLERLSGLPGSEIDFFQASFDARWEVDLFGGTRRGRQSADARAAAAALNLADVRASVASEVVRDYVALREAQARLAVARANLAAADRSASIAREREGAGIVTGFEVANAEAAALAIKAAAPRIEREASEARIRLAVLAAREPTALAATLSPPVALGAAPPMAGAGIPSELLRRRPDVRQAERLLAAATYDVGVAVADLYPSFTINGSAGLQSVEPGNLFEWGSRFFRVAGNLTAPVFDAGRRKGEVERRRAIVDEALARYRSAVLGAFRDVEQALVALERDGEALELREREIARRRAAVAVAREQDRAGLISFSEVLDAERALLASEDDTARARAAVLVDWSALQKALGGGWTPPAEPTTSTGKNTP